MEVKIAFDTEKENIEELKKLVASIQDLIAKREAAEAAFLKKPELTEEINSPNEETDTPEEPPQEQKTDKEKTEGGCQIIPFEDMTGTMEKIYSGKA